MFRPVLRSFSELVPINAVIPEVRNGTQVTGNDLPEVEVGYLQDLNLFLCSMSQENTKAKSEEIVRIKF